MTRLAAPPQLGRDGRLGNQLFMMSATLALAWRDGAVPAFPDDWRYRHVWEFPDGWFVARGDLVGLPQVTNHPAVAHLPERWRHYLQDVSLLDGFWPRLASMWRASLTADAASVLAAAEVRCFDGLPGPVLSVHVRRGDNVTNPPGTINAVDPEFYPRAVQVARAAAPFPLRSVAVFSDDPDWCEQNRDLLGAADLPLRVFHGASRSKETDPAYLTESADEWIDLLLGAHCSAHVLSNSTFAWWSAALSSNRRPVYPSYWVGPELTGSGFDPSLLFPAGWRRVDASPLTTDTRYPAG